MKLDDAPGATLPDPLTPETADLRAFPYMPLDVARLRDSSIAGVDEPESFRAAVLLWCAAWQQLPAGSLPANDDELRRLAGYGRDQTTWKRADEGGALRGWLLCSDGRLYHPVVAEKVLETLGKKKADRARTANATAARILKQAREQMEALGNNDDETSQSRTRDVDVTSPTGPRDVDVNSQEGKEGKEGKEGNERKGVEGTESVERPASPPPCPHQEIVDLYHEILPNHRRAEVRDERRMALIGDRWTQVWAERKRRGSNCDAEALKANFRRIFMDVASSKFLTGLVPGRNGRPPFIADLAWLMAEENFIKVVEAKYHDQAST